MVGFGDSHLGDGVGAGNIAGRDSDSGGAGMGGGVGCHRIREDLVATLGGVFIAGEPGSIVAPAPTGVGGNRKAQVAAAGGNAAGVRVDGEATDGLTRTHHQQGNGQKGAFHPLLS